jgi:hypothetical protein
MGLEANDSLPDFGELAGQVEACRPFVVADPPERAEHLESLRESTEQRIAGERGIVARLRSLSTPARMAAIVGAAALTTFAAYLVHPRADWGDYPLGRMIFTLVVLGALAALAMWRLIRPIHLPPAPVWTAVVLLIAGLFVPLLCAAIPVTGEHVPPGEGLAFYTHCLRCIGVGSLAGVPVLALAALARRSKLDGPAIAGLGGVGAGLIGNFALQLVCATVEIGHLLLGHVSLLVLLGAAMALSQR